MDFWQKARSFAEDASKISQDLTKEVAKQLQELTKEAVKRSQDFTIGSSKLSGIVMEASKRSKEIVAEASKKAVMIKVEELKHADQIKSQVPSTYAAISQLVHSSASRAVWGHFGCGSREVCNYGGAARVLMEVTINTFPDFPL